MAVTGSRDQTGVKEPWAALFARMSALIVLVMLLHQFVMTSAMHAELMPVLSSDSLHARGDILVPGETPHPTPSEYICPAVQGALPMLAWFVLVVVVLIVLALAACCMTWSVRVAVD